MGKKRCDFFKYPIVRIKKLSKMAMISYKIHQKSRIGCLWNFKIQCKYIKSLITSQLATTVLFSHNCAWSTLQHYFGCNYISFDFICNIHITKMKND